MSETLIVAILGQVVTLAVVFIQQIYNNKSLKIQLQSNNKKDFNIEKRKIYKILLNHLNIESLIKENYSITFFDALYDDIYLYSSEDVISSVDYVKRQCIIINDSNNSLNVIENSKKMLPYTFSNLRKTIKKEYENI